MIDALLRFAFGGALVATFALLGDLFEPKSFAGLFAAAPSIAVATLALTAREKGGAYAAVEARSMVVGGLAFLGYATAVGLALRRRGGRPLAAAAKCLALWGGLSAAGWALWLRAG
ncbi:MAG TPA: DUF3147 family protein [Polyangia bacterium]|nr:DUF3147 family protein [Polyangia bacterium]